MSASAIPPTVIADAVSAARNFLRTDGAAEGALLERLAATAIVLGEAYTGTVFVARVVEDVVPAADDWRMLATAPVTAIAGVTGLPADGAPFVLPVNAYAVDIDGDIAMVWSPYVFTIDGKVAHCGTDHFDMVREDGRWKIANLTWSKRTTGCAN